MLAQVEEIAVRARRIRSLILAELEGVPTRQINKKPGDRWSAREVLIHLGNWEEQAVIWLNCDLARKPWPADERLPIDEWNARHLAPHADLDVAGALKYIEQTRADLEWAMARVMEKDFAEIDHLTALLVMTPDHEAGHLHQIREALATARGDFQQAAVSSLAYARQRILDRIDLENRAEALTWRPPAGGWTIKEMLSHLAIWDRQGVAIFNAVAENREVPPEPYEPGGLDRWNQEQVALHRGEPLAEVLHELGEARGALEAALRRLSDAQMTDEQTREWVANHRAHDDHHMHKMMELLKQWRQQNPKH